MVSLDGSLETLQGRDIVLMRDLNVDILNKADPRFRPLKSLQLSLQLHSVIQSTTRLTVTSTKCLDVILSNHSAFSYGYVEHLPFTDHALVDSISNNEELSDNLGPRFISRRHWKIPDNQEEQLENALLCTFKEPKASGINERWVGWRNEFLSALDQVAQVITTKFSSTKRRYPWMTAELLNIIHRQKSIYRKVVRSGGKDLDSVRLHRVVRSQ